MLAGRVTIQEVRARIGTTRHKTLVAATRSNLRAATQTTPTFTQAVSCPLRTPTTRVRRAYSQSFTEYYFSPGTSPSRNHHRHHYSTSPIMAEVSTERMVYDALQSYGHTKWGFVFYRTSYTSASETLWPRFQSILTQRARDIISNSDTPELLDTLDYKFVSDSARLVNADVATVQQIHAAWRSSPAAQAEQPEGSFQVWPSDIPRYKHCVQADEETMKSVVEGPQPPEIDFLGKTFVKFLHCDWPSHAEPRESWMLLASWMMATDAYDIFHDDNINWYTFWKAPPTIVRH